MRIPGETFWTALSDGSSVGASGYARTEPVDAMQEQLPQHFGNDKPSDGKFITPTRPWTPSMGERRHQQRRVRSLATPLDTRISDRRRPPGTFLPICCKI